jgi:hypothetical protein
MPPAGGGGGTQSIRFHELLRQVAPQYLERFGSSMPGRQREVLRRILRCRTPALGGELFRCPDCGQFHYRYHSCNDRHCPLCGQHDADQWLEKQRKRLLLPVVYFLVTFTVPEPLRACIRSHPQLGYELLFAASAQALQDLAANPKRLGAQLGMLGILHTWSRTLIYHPHIHYLVPGGGLSLDQRSWVASRRKFLLHVKPLAARFRTLFRDLLGARAPELLALLPAKVWKQSWVVHSQAVGSGEKALAYLARYIFKTATGNRQLNLLPSGQVLWPYRQSATGKSITIPLAPSELVRRFLQHVLPVRFSRVRLFGWLHPAAKVRSNRVRALLKQAPILTEQEHQIWEVSHQLEQQTPLSKLNTLLCARCGTVLILVGSWRPGQRWPSQPRAP